MLRYDRRFKLTGLRGLFCKLRKNYRLDGLTLAVTRKHILDFKDSHCRSMYLPTLDAVVMRDRRLYPRNIQYMLHEMCHAIQHREKRLLVPETHTRTIYALELEAEIFARTEYRKLLAKTYGKGKTEWDLADYKAYCGADGECYSMEVEEIYRFVKQLKGAVKRPILKRLDRKYDTKEDWETVLCKIEV